MAASSETFAGKISPEQMEHICQRILRDVPNLPIGPEMLRDYIHGNDIGFGDQRFRLAVMKGRIEGKERFVFFFGEDHRGGSESFDVGNRVIMSFDNFGLESFEESGLRKLSGDPKKPVNVLEVGRKFPSILDRAAIYAKYFGKTFVNLSENEEALWPVGEVYKTSRRIKAGVTVVILSTAGLFGSILSNMFLHRSRVELSPTEKVLGLIDILSTLYIVWKLKQFSPAASSDSDQRSRDEIASKSLGIVSYSQRQGVFEAANLARYELMCERMVEFFRTHPDAPYLLVMEGKDHVPSEMRILRNKYDFEHIPLKLRSGNSLATANQ